MAKIAGALLSGLPEGVRQLLAAAPVTQKKLLELGMLWTDLPPEQARIAEQLRVFVVTWDPLEFLAARPDGFATVNADPSGYELVVYLPVWTVVELAVVRDATIAAVLASMAGSAVVTAAASERPIGSGGSGLLSDHAAGAALGTPEIQLKSPDWEDIGLGAITDVVQHGFGPVDLDRSIVELAAATRPRAGCPACIGGRFGFPGELAEARAEMCRAHRAEAETVIRTRLDRAAASNPDGWGALGDATQRLELPHLPNGLASKLVGAEEAMYVVPEPDVLARRAQLVVEAAAWFPGRRDEFAIALGEEPALAGQLPEWLVNLVLDLGRAGLGAEAAVVGEALALVAPDLRAVLDGDVPVALAQAGMAEQARARIESNLTRWPDDFWIRLHAGDALAALGERDGAVAHFEVALTMADETDDFEARFDAVERIREIGAQGFPPRRRSSASTQRKRKKRHSATRNNRKR